MRLRPSAPASSQALAMAVMSVTFGESLTMTGFLTASLTARVTAAAALRVGAEAHAAAVDVGAGDIDLQPADLRAGVELLADLDVFVHAKSR